jgi:hypothetical protein
VSVENDLDEHIWPRIGSERRSRQRRCGLVVRSAQCRRAGLGRVFVHLATVWVEVSTRIEKASFLA